MQTTFINRTVAPPAQYYRNYPQPQQPPRPDVRDDYERWYTEPVSNNRMMLSLRSGIHSEVGWALDRLCRLAHNEQFSFSQLPGLIDGLFDWPEWYVTEGYKTVSPESAVFSVNPAHSRQRRFALESLFILRNASLHDPNVRELASHTHTFPLIANGINNLDHTVDENVEALLHLMDILIVLAPIINLTIPYYSRLNPIPGLIRIASTSSNRTMIITSLTALSGLFSHPSNSVYLTSDSPALKTAIRYLPLFAVDLPLIDAALNYLYAHISYPAMSRAFLLHPEMPAAIKVLANLLVHEQQALKEQISIDVCPNVPTAPAAAGLTRDHELTKEELDSFVEKPEPQRCYDWMRTMFVAKTEGEMTQVDFWNLYKDAFTPFAEQHPLLVASDVIKNVTSVFPEAQAMVLPGPTPRFIVRGVDRRKDSIVNERFRCHWDRSQCTSTSFDSPSQLYDHVLDHLNESEMSETPCLWANCDQAPLAKRALCTHVLTHISSTLTPDKPPSQSDTITLSTEYYPYPTADPTQRPIPPLKNTMLVYDQPRADPPSTSLTALLILRILFRTSFASSEAAPKNDADHFGFPGILEDTDDPADGDQGVHDVGGGDDKEGEKRGRKAFIGIRKFLDGLQIKDEALQSWVTEMLDVGVTPESVAVLDDQESV